MENIINKVVENLKQELIDFFGQMPDLSDTETFTFTKLKAMMLQLTRAYAEEIDAAVCLDKSGRRKEGLRIERHGDERVVLTDIGELHYQRSYFSKKDGTYDYPVDRVLGVDSYQRVSNNTILKLTDEARRHSYESASRIVTEGKVSKQSVMNAIRRCQAVEEEQELRHVPVLHIDADEDHVNLQNGRTLIAPLVTVYEGLEKIGNGKRARHRCINAFHKAGCKTNEEFWEEVYESITDRYDLRGTRIYLHGDGAAWIKQGVDCFPNCTFVLDCYHRNKAKKMVFAGCKKGESIDEKRNLAIALQYGNRKILNKVWTRRIMQNPEYRDRIDEGMNYLSQNLDAIAVRYADPETRNGGATEPHISHVLSSRLSSRPMGWSLETLEHLIPILATKSFSLNSCGQTMLPKYLEGAGQKAIEKMTSKKKYSLFAVDPDRSVTSEVISNGHVTQLYQVLKGIGM